MPTAEVEQHQFQQQDATRLSQLGGWLFRHRTATPVPFFVALLFVRSGEAAPSPQLIAAGVTIVAFGEGIRLWGVHHIGAISRTRADRLGPLVDNGPFALVRNPLYLGNIALWAGFALIARLVWMAPIIIALLGFEYHAIVRWEEDLLTSRLGAVYRDYMARVPRWIPALRRARGAAREGLIEDARPSSFASSAADPFSWRDTFFSERGTLIAIAVGYALLWIKARF
jgi:protein-S-isoprenylcysteine O-methyltransferase Ste14